MTSRSPGPGLSRARRGTDIPGEWDRSSRSACGPLASPTRPTAVGGRQGCGIRPDPVHPRLLPHGAGGAQGSPDAADTLRPASAVFSRCGSPRGGGSRPAAAPRALRPALWWCPWSVPGRPSGVRGRVGGVASRSRRPRWVVPLKCVCVGVESARPREERHPFPPRSRWGVSGASSVGPPARIWRSGSDSRMGAVPCLAFAPHAVGGGGCRAGGRGRPGAGGFPAAGCEGCAARSRFPVDDGGFRPRVVVRAVHRPKASARGGRRPAPCTRTADPHPPGAGVVRAPWPSPAGKCPGPGAMPPSVRKPSLAIRRGCLGVPHPPAAAPRLRVSVWPALGFQGGSSAPCGEGPRAMLSRPTAARASPHRVGGGSRTGPGPASPVRFWGPRWSWVACGA